MCLVIGLHYIPHLRLAFRTVMSFACESVVRMHLDGEVVAGVDELDQKRELGTSLCIYLFTEKRTLEFGRKFCDVPALERTLCNY